MGTPTPTPPESTLSFRPESVTRALATAAAIFVGLSVTGQVLKFITGHDRIRGFIPLFHVGTEANATTYFSALLHLFAAVLLARIHLQEWRTGGRFSRYWLGLAGLFVYLSVDEAAAIHEQLIRPVRRTIDATGLFYFAWVIPGLAFVALLAVLLYPFLRTLPRRTFRLFLLAAVLFVSGAIGMEILGGAHYEQYGDTTITYSIMVTIEESLELAGILIFIHALLLHIRDTAPALRIRLEEASTTAATAGDRERSDTRPAMPPSTSA